MQPWRLCQRSTRHEPKPSLSLRELRRSCHGFTGNGKSISFYTTYSVNTFCHMFSIIPQAYLVWDERLSFCGSSTLPDPRHCSILCQAAVVAGNGAVATVPLQTVGNEWLGIASGQVCVCLRIFDVFACFHFYSTAHLYGGCELESVETSPEVVSRLANFCVTWNSDTPQYLLFYFLFWIASFY